MIRARMLPLFILCLAALLACGGAESESPTPDVSAEPVEETPAPAIELTRVREARLGARIAASGTVEARRVTEVAAEVAGPIVAIHVDVGDAVDAGAPLFRVDPSPYQMAVNEARAGLRLAEAESSNAAAEADRVRQLIELKAASQQRYDQLRTQADVAEARVAQAHARLARARRDLEHTEVTAPYAGSVVERRAHEGAMASAGSAVLVLQESGALEAILAVPEATPVPVRVGDAMRLFAEGRATPIETTVSRVSDRIDADTRTYEVRGEVKDHGGAVKAGSYVRAELEPSRSEALPVVDRSALLTRDGRTYLLRVDDGVVEHVPVRVGIVTEDRVEILSGVEPGTLAVRGSAVQRLPPGTRLRLRETSEGVSTAERSDGANAPSAEAQGSAS